MSVWEESFETFVKNFALDPKYGYMSDPDLKQLLIGTDFLQIMEDLPHLNETGQIIERVEKMKPLSLYYAIKEKLDPVQKEHFCFLLHETSAYIINAYGLNLLKKGIRKEDIVIPINIGSIMYKTSQELGLKYGISGCFGVIWEFTDPNKEYDIDNLDIEDIRMRWCFTHKEYDERLFFGTSTITSLYLFEILKIIYRVNHSIQTQPEEEDKISSDLKRIVGYWVKAKSKLEKVFTDLNGEYFYHVLRPFVQGFEDVYFEVLDVKISSNGGGAGGYDPLFQVFERAFGITYEGSLQNASSGFLKGMRHKSKGMIEFMEKNSQIKEYFSLSPKLKEAYNEVVHSYGQFLKRHSYLIKNFILKYAREERTKNNEKKKADDQKKTEIKERQKEIEEKEDKEEGVGGFRITDFIERGNNVLSSKKLK